MEQIYGAVTPFTVMMIVTLLTQWVKSAWTLTSKQVQLVALGFSFLFITTYQLLTIPDITPFAVFASILYALLGWFSAIGMYEVASKQLTRQ